MTDGEGTRLVRTNRTIRTAAFAYSLIPIGLYLAQASAGAAAWMLALRDRVGVVDRAAGC